MKRTPDESREPIDQRRHVACERFIALWGQMGSSWGIPRTMAETHALLFLSDAPLNTDDVMDRLDISRGNASMTLRSLVEWGIVRKVHIRGDRKEYFEAEHDVVRLFRSIFRERKRREFDPLLDELRACRTLTETGGDDARTDEHNRKLDRLLELLQLVNALSSHLTELSDTDVLETARLFVGADEPRTRGAAS
ncbi:MAG: MarR family transcriptional regulator [Phycisphaerales bacterium]|nr:MarR family transcriptional regulator [Phycisphaerales bacterium]